MLKKINDLAIFGAKPAFKEELYVGCPNIGEERVLLRRIKDLLRRRWLTNRGPFAQEFEKKVAKKLGVKHCIAMCNGTIALEIAIRALDLKGEVIIPSFTFIATAHALQWQQVTPVFCDIAPGSYTIDPSKIENLITPNTTGIIGVHLWGKACDIGALTSIAKKHKLKLLFDAAHSFNCSYDGRMVGGFGDAEILSFHATKFLNTFEGGAVVTNDDELAKKIRLMQNFGFSWYDNVIFIGTNGKMSEVSAAMGLTGLESIKKFIDHNYRNYKYYQRELEDLPGVKLVLHSEKEKHNYQYVIIELDEEKAYISRDQLMKLLHSENIIVRRYFYPGCHNMAPYNALFPNAGLVLPETEKKAHRVIALPTGMAVGIKDVKKICSIIKFAVENGQEIKRNFPKGQSLEF